MIDIRKIEIVTPDIERSMLIERNAQLKNFSILLFSLLVITITVYTVHHLNQEQNRGN